VLGMRLERPPGGATILAILTWMGFGLAGGCAGKMGGRAAAGAVDTLAERGAAAPPGERPIEVVTGRAIDEAIAHLNEAEQVAALRAVAGAAADAAVQRALQAAITPRGPGQESLVQTLSGQAAESMRDTLLAGLQGEPGPEGTGPLGLAMGRSARQIAALATDGAMERVFPGCRSGDTACVDRRVAGLGRAAAAGFVGGVSASLRTAAVILAFVGGAICALLIVLGVSLARSHRAPRRSPELAHSH
jgi:hypothetical protein